MLRNSYNEKKLSGGMMYKHILLFMLILCTFSTVAQRSISAINYSPFTSYVNNRSIEFFDSSLVIVQNNAALEYFYHREEFQTLALGNNIDRQVIGIQPFFLQNDNWHSKPLFTNSGFARSVKLTRKSDRKSYVINNTLVHRIYRNQNTDYFDAEQSILIHRDGVFSEWTIYPAFKNIIDVITFNNRTYYATDNYGVQFIDDDDRVLPLFASLPQRLSRASNFVVHNDHLYVALSPVLPDEHLHPKENSILVAIGQNGAMEELPLPVNGLTQLLADKDIIYAYGAETSIDIIGETQFIGGIAAIQEKRVIPFDFPPVTHIARMETDKASLLIESLLSFDNTQIAYQTGRMDFPHLKTETKTTLFNPMHASVLTSSERLFRFYPMNPTRPKIHISAIDNALLIIENDVATKTSKITEISTIRSHQRPTRSWQLANSAISRAFTTNAGMFYADAKHLIYRSSFERPEEALVIFRLPARTLACSHDKRNIFWIYIADDALKLEKVDSYYFKKATTVQSFQFDHYTDLKAVAVSQDILIYQTTDNVTKLWYLDTEKGILLPLPDLEKELREPVVSRSQNELLILNVPSGSLYRPATLNLDSDTPGWEYLKTFHGSDNLGFYAFDGVVYWLSQSTYLAIDINEYLIDLDQKAGGLNYFELQRQRQQQKNKLTNASQNAAIQLKGRKIKPTIVIQKPQVFDH
jgi:hypothetical protein